MQRNNFILYKTIFLDFTLYVVQHKKERGNFDTPPRRGYDPIPYLPVFANEIIESHDVSQRFMNDYKQTVSDLIAEHYRYQQEVAHKDGLLTMCEASGPHQNQSDALLCQKYSDVPMGEFWARSKTHRISLKQRFLTKEAVSAGHIYGKNVISAESFTSVGPQWEEDPYFLKPTADRAFCEGINKLYFHTYPHSPSLTAKPGFVYYAGTYINRNTTWWNYSLDWNTYLARNQYVLQQGTPVVDVCIYYGTGIEKRIQYKQDSALMDLGYQYDYVNSDVILNQMSVQDGKICLPNGISYELLVLPEESGISIEVLEKIREMVYDGATIVGPRPICSIGLYKSTEIDRQIKSITNLLWGELDTPLIDRTVGNGKIVYGKNIDQILSEKKIEPDLKIENRDSNFSLDFIHRRNKEYDIYYLANLREEAIDYATLSFRTSGKVPYIWNPVDGTVIEQRVYVDDGERTHIPCSFDPYGSYFIIFEKKENAKPSIISVTGPDGNRSCFLEKSGNYQLTYSNGESKNITIASARYLTINTSWNVSFSTEMGGPGSVEFKNLISWPESENLGIKYYSGTASYQNTFIIKDEIEGAKVFLDLGELYNVAEIVLNGHNLGTCWLRPFQKEISEYVKQGRNKIEIKVTNLWPNRLIGDQFLPEAERYTQTNISKSTRQDTLRPSGLLGPVRLMIIPDRDEF